MSACQIAPANSPQRHPNVIRLPSEFPTPVVRALPVRAKAWAVRARVGLCAYGRSGMPRTVQIISVNQLAGGLGFEPRLAESESAVLPLDDPPSRSIA